MALKNTSADGVDWINGAVLLPIDLNDTFDGIYDLVNYTE